ncbi:atp3 gamma subunit of the F1 sector of mitochondrial F1F0 ATP synthase [Coemansia sp. RSA 990]|nr:atp3 gamma subunit of the F1 sector of mitochondrial F1F0 ATP synthase [Coemansia sp. RSA 990]
MFARPAVAARSAAFVQTRNMATLKEIQVRLKSVTNISKITASMKMIASTKTTRAQRAMNVARIYGQVSNDFVKQAEVEKAEGAKELLVTVSSDKGLCGGIHSSLARQSRKYLGENSEAPLVVLGDKAKVQLQRAYPENIKYSFNQLGSSIPTFDETSVIASTILNDKDLAFDNVKLLYNKFVSAIAFETSSIECFPIKQIVEAPNFKAYEYQEEVLENLNEFLFANSLHWALVEGHAAEMAAKRTAMENATKNAGDMINKLTLQYNRGRQAVITNELIDIITDIMQAIENVVQATVEYSEQLALEVRKISTNIKAVDAMVSPVRIEQVLATIEMLERRVQGLIRYGWLIEREWNVYVKADAESVFPTGYLRGLDTWHMVLAKAMARVRVRAAEARYGQSQAESDEAQAWETSQFSPVSWSAEYVLERAKADRAKADRGKNRRADPWLEAVPPLAARPGQPACTQVLDIQRRNALHYAAQSTSDLAWLRRLNIVDVQELRLQTEASRLPSLAAVDLAGDSPLTIAARMGNVSAVRYIIEESGVDAASASLADAAVLAFAEGHRDCLGPIVERLVAFPEKIALVVRMSMFYGFAGLFDAVSAALKSAGARAYMSAEVALEQSARRMGGTSMLHVAALNNQDMMVRLALEQKIFRSSAFDVHFRDDTGLSALDMTNYFGYRACADELLAVSTEFDSPVYDGMRAEPPALQVEPFEASCTGLAAAPGTYGIFVTLGSNDLRRGEKFPPISLDKVALQSVLDKMQLPRSTHLLLRVDAEHGVLTGGGVYVVDVTSLLETPDLSEHTWAPPVHFHTAYPEKFVLRLDLIALIDHALAPYAGEHKIIAQAALTLPPTYNPGYSERVPGQYIPLCLTGSSYLQTVFVAAATDGIVGEANIEALVSTPYRYGALTPQSSRPITPTPVDISTLRIDEGVSEAVVPWHQPGRTLIYGHRGSGMNFPFSSSQGRLQLGENTVLSMQKSIRDGVAAVEFDVQLTRDMAPIIYHDWLVAETGIDAPANILSLAQFMALNPRNRIPQASRSCEDLSTDLVHALPTDPSLAPAVVANSRDTIQEPFATLHDLFESLPPGVGFDIEVKYPMPDEADGVGMTTSFEINLFVDRILDVVYSYIGCPAHLRGDDDAVKPASSLRRPIVFTSFHPDICVLLAHKVGGDIPVMLLTDAGMSAMADARCNSIDVAVRLCKWAGLAGIVTHVGPIMQSLRVASLVRRHKLVLATYGDLNNQPESVQLQQAYGVDVVIADDVRAASGAVFNHY